MPTAALLVGTGLSGGGQILQGFQSQKSANIAATQDIQQGQIQATQAAGRISAEDIEANKTMAAVRANAGASGVAAGSGSARAVNAMNAAQQTLRDTYTNYQANYAKEMAYYRARADRYSGNQALYGSLVSAGTTALTSYMAYKGMGAATPQTGGTS
jgi:hypothetical protein